MEPQLRAKGIATLYLFGSVARREDGPNSDVDLAFVIDPHRLDNFSLIDQANAKSTLADTLGMAVDLIILSDLRPELRTASRVTFSGYSEGPKNIARDEPRAAHPPGPNRRCSLNAAVGDVGVPEA